MLLDFLSYYWYFILAGIILIVIIILAFAWKNKSNKKSKNDDLSNPYYFLSYDKFDKLWEIKKSTNTKATKRFFNKEDAINYGKQIASKNDIEFKEE